MMQLIQSMRRNRGGTWSGTTGFTGGATAAAGAAPLPPGAAPGLFAAEARTFLAGVFFGLLLFMKVQALESDEMPTG